MRLPFPERIPLVPLSYFAGLLCFVQLIEGTDPTFALCSFFCILLSGLAFNVAGGFTRPSGSYIFSFAVLALIVGLFWKAVVGEPAQTNLQSPLLSIGVYLGCMFSMVVAIVISRRISTKKAILETVVAESKMQRAIVGCLITGIILNICFLVLPGGNGSILSALAQLNSFFPLTIVLGTIHAIRRSGGTRSVSLPVLIAGFLLFIQGLFGFSKQGIITPFVCWLIAAASQRYRVSRVQIGIFLVTGYLIVHYLVPYAQYGRSFREESASANFNISLSLLSNLGAVRDAYLETVVESDEDDEGYYYYNTRQGFFDRLQALSMDDAIIAYKHNTGLVGIYPIIQDFENLIPHFIWKGKPTLNQGNAYAHELGMLAEDDITTGISFSPAAESYILIGWAGVFILAPLLWCALFTVYDSLCGDLRQVPWGLLVAVSFYHAGPEGGLGGIIYMLGFSVIGLIFAVVVTAYVMPVVGTFFLGPEGIQVRSSAPIRSVPGRMRLPRPSES